MTGATTRKATADGIDALLRIEERCFEADWISRRSFRALIARPPQKPLVTMDGAVIGYAMILPSWHRACATLLIAVDPEAKVKGVGSLLLQAAETAAYDHDRPLLRLEVREDNECAPSRFTSGMATAPLTLSRLLR